MTAASTLTAVSLFGAPFYTGLLVTSSEIPGRYPVALGGRGFLVDFESNEYAHQSIPLLREQADQSSTPGEGSVNPEDLWRRSITSWHKGGGQKHFDLTDSFPNRFDESKGIDPWTEGQISLFPESVQHTGMASLESNLYLTTAGTRLYATAGGVVQHTSDVLVSPTVWTPVTGVSLTAPTSITSDGYSVWTSHDGDGVWLTDTSTSASTQAYTGTVAGCKYLKGRLFAWGGNSLYNLTAAPPAALPLAMLSHPSAQFAWVDMAEANGFYFAAGVLGDKSTIYFSAVKDDGTGLEATLVAAELPDGEIIRSIQGYLGFLVIGTDMGIRFGSPNDQGNVTLGGLIDEVPEVGCFEGQGPFIWFGWSQFDATSSGLGRMDLASFNGTRPAYASDLMATVPGGAGDVRAVVTFQGQRVYSVSGTGIFVEGTDRVSSGYFTTGKITYGLGDMKVSMYLNVNHEPLAGSLAASMSRDHADFDSIGTGGTSGTVVSTFSTNQGRARSFNVKATLTRDPDSVTLGPVVGSMTLRAYPAASRSERVTIPLILGTNQRDLTGGSTTRSIADDLAFLRSLESSGSMTTLQEAFEASSVVVEDHLWRPYHFEGTGMPAGTYLVQLKRFSEE